MSRSAARREGPTALEWIEGALYLLRTAPPGALLCYYAGAIPGMIGVLFFWADMSRGAFAGARLIEASLGMAGFYLWMKCWQTAFASKLRAHLFMEPEAPWTGARLFRLALVQTALQPWGLFLRLLAAQILLPYVWTYSFFMGIAILGDGTEPSLRAVVRGALRQSVTWWQQTHLALLCLLGFAVFIWLNVTMTAALLPYMLRTFLGIQTPFTRDLWSMFNTTFFAATFAVTYLCFDPLRKAVFVLRNFHAGSRRSGEDLRVELKALRQRAAVAALALVLSFASVPTAARAQEVPPPRVESTTLNESLDRVLQQREYSWRLPRSQMDDGEQKGWLGNFFEGVGKKIMSWMKKADRLLKRLFDWLRDLLKLDIKGGDSGSTNWSVVANGTLYALIAALVVALGYVLWRWHKGRRSVVITAHAVEAMPDLNEESVTADQLPEDGWRQLGQELIERGELRLALRAFYLAGLAHLGQRELIRLARHKSNHDYELELSRRARGNDRLLTAFDANLLAFERSWYGDHAVTSETLGGFSQNLERMRTC